MATGRQGGYKYIVNELERRVQESCLCDSSYHSTAAPHCKYTGATFDRHPGDSFIGGWPGWEVAACLLMQPLVV